MVEQTVTTRRPSSDRLPHPSEPKAVRLQKLRDLLNRGLISVAEYDRHRADTEDEI